MNFYTIGIESALALTGLVLLLVDLVIPPERRRLLGYAAAAVVGVMFLYSLSGRYAPVEPVEDFGGSAVLDGLAVFFKRFFLLAAALVLLVSVEFSGKLKAGAAEFYALTLFALVGMLFAASANNFAMLFVAIELITVTFYVLTSYQRNRLASLEAGVKYLIIGAVS
ncbi:MAG TPA: proton-conducting transporter membrane subunit, partial [Verrucomicrobiota bacterium]|nr:proton-conducting transporter membrane subunit [Verrucomicrobiota bacterium]